MLQLVKHFLKKHYPAIHRVLKNKSIMLRNLWDIAQGRPIRLIPSGLLDKFTMGGNVPVVLNIAITHRSSAIAYSVETIAATRAKIARREVGHYGQVDAWLYEALDKYPLQGRLGRGDGVGGPRVWSVV